MAAWKCAPVTAQYFKRIAGYASVSRQKVVVVIAQDAEGVEDSVKLSFKGDKVVTSQGVVARQGWKLGPSAGKAGSGGG